MTDAKIRDCCRFLYLRNGRRPLDPEKVEEILFLANSYYHKKWGEQIVDLDDVTLPQHEISFSSSRELYATSHVGGLVESEHRALGKAMTMVLGMRSYTAT